MTQQQLEARANARAHQRHIHVMAVKGRPGVYTVTSLSEPGTKHYLVASDGITACDCKGYTYRKSCCHVEALRNRLGREAVVARRTSAASLLYAD